MSKVEVVGKPQGTEIGPLPASLNSSQPSLLVRGYEGEERLLGFGEELLFQEARCGEKGLVRCQVLLQSVLLVWTHLILLIPNEAGVISIPFYRCGTEGPCTIHLI